MSETPMMSADDVMSNMPLNSPLPLLPALDSFGKSGLTLNEWDARCMRRAIALGELGKETAAPNPWVGCVITNKQGDVIGEGYHQKAGQRHAEIRAIQNVEDRLVSEAGDADITEEEMQLRLESCLAGATCYTTLEPCSHTGRTPPCDQQLIKYRFGRVVVAVVDPDDKVAGSGIHHLVDAGIQVDTGLCREEAEHSLRAYLKHRRTGMPWVVLKIATSLDGKIGHKTSDASSSRSSISNEESRADMHKRWRASSQAILIGTGTAYADDPELTTRHWYDHVDRRLVTPPLRVVLGSANHNFQCPPKLANSRLGPTVVISNSVSIPIPNVSIGMIRPADVGATAENPRPDFELVLKALGKQGVLQVLVEGGATLAGNVLQDGHVDEFIVYMAPTVLGNAGVEWSASLNEKIDLAKAYQLSRTQTFGDDVCLEYLRR